MKQKHKMLLLLFTITLMMGSSLNVNTAYSSSDTTLSVNPEMMYVQVGESFTIDLKVANVELLHEWQINLSFNPNVLRFINVTEGDFLIMGERETAGFSYLDEIEKGWALFSWSILGQFSESGSGTLASVEFEVLAIGESKLDLVTEPVWNEEFQTWLNMTHLTKMNPPPVPPGGTELEDIPFTAVDGIFFNLEDPPVAMFTYSPEIPLLDTTITFNASLSYATAPREIVEYYWDFDDKTNASGMIVEHAYTTGGIYNVTLTVIDDTNATTLVEDLYNTTGMPRIWYDLYSSSTQTVAIMLGHDIAVTNVKTSKTEVTVGETVSINVTVLNKGIETEDFNVKAYYDGNLIGTKPVAGLSPGAEETLIFNWDTTGVAEGDYTMKAKATDVEGEGNPLDNEFIDGTVTVMSGSQPFPTTLVIGAVVAVAVVAIILFMYMRRRSTSPA